MHRGTGEHILLIMRKLPEAVLSALGALFQREQNFNAWVGIAYYVYGEHKYPVGMVPIRAAALHNSRCLVQYVQQNDWGSLH